MKMALERKRSSWWLVISLFIVPTGFAQSTFNAFWDEFKTAVGKDDRAVVAKLTQFPYTHQNQQLDRDGFYKIYPRVFDAKTKRCLSKAKPVREQNTYSVFCGKLIYVFELDGGGYKFTGTHPDD